MKTTALLGLVALCSPLLTSAGPLPPPVPLPASMPQALPEAGPVLQPGSMTAAPDDCARLRALVRDSARQGRPPESSLAAEWGFRCGESIDDGVFYAMRLCALTVSGSGEVAAAASVDGRVFIMDLKTSRTIAHWDTWMSDISDLDLSPDGALAAAGGERRVMVRRIRDGKSVWAGDMESYVSRVRFSPDGQSLAIGLNKQTSTGESPAMEGTIHFLSLSDLGRMTMMKSVPGNPFELAVTGDGERIVALCWPRLYTFNTVVWLGIWNARTGEPELARELRTTQRYPSHLSRDGRVMVYNRLDDNQLLEHKRLLDRQGRIREPLDLAGSDWLRRDSSYHAVAQEVFTGHETPITGGLSFLALDDAGRWVAVSGSDGVRTEEIGAGRRYEVKLDSDPAASIHGPLAAFGAAGRVLVMGRTNADLTRFGWLSTELPGPARMAGPITQ